MRDDEGIADDALAFARKHKTRIAKSLTSKEDFPPEVEPLSVFMAGSPGAGKTEISKEYVAALDDLKSEEFEGFGSILRIDPDDLRDHFPGYTGNNSWLFQRAVSIVVDKIHDLMLKQRQSFILDGTLSRLEGARKNVQRSLRRGRAVQIFYVYQDPALAWEFVKSREEVEGRNIPLQSFISQFLDVRDVVTQLKEEFGDQLTVDVIIKNNDGSSEEWLSDVQSIEDCLPERYTREQLERLFAGEG
tara:strand:- start:265 stop:1002 length:738 start_codon:yes stop_codon:yes gene_type:complete